MMKFGLKHLRETVITRADRAFRCGDRELAIRLYRKALDRNPHNPPIWVQCGHVLKESGRLDEAEVAYRLSIAQEPRTADPYLHLGHTLKLQGRREEAERAYVEALTLDPTSPHAKNELTALGWEEDRVSELAATTPVRKAVPAGPANRAWGAVVNDRRPSTITLADRARDGGDWATAARLYRKALNRRPNNPAIWVQYGHTLKETGRLREAEAAYRTALRQRADADGYLQLGRVLRLQALPEEAASAFLTALALDSSVTPVLDELRRIGWSEEKVCELSTTLRGMHYAGSTTNRDQPAS